MQTLLVAEKTDRIEVILNRPSFNNSINFQLLKELNTLLDQLEKNKSPSILIIKGQAEFFCTGMDLKEVLFSKDKETWANLFIETLERFTKSSKIIISVVDGKVTAGGLGLIAASDFVFATERSTFKLTELLLGLLPAMIAPFLINKIGFQKFHTLALSSETIEAKEAYRIGLVDFLHENLDPLIHRINRVSPKTLKDFKQFFLEPIDKKKAIQKITLLLNDPETQSSINLILNKKK